MRILLVEDDRPLAEAMSRALRVENFVVDLARDGEDGQHLGLTGVARRVTLTATDTGGVVAIAIGDDGPGLTGEAMAAVRPGLRLDELGSGYGFGLPIARELAELYGGSVELGRSALGGLEVTVRLPRPGVGAAR